MVTGHTGFKGSWLTLWLHTLGARIIGYSLAPPTTPSNFEASGIAELVETYHAADVRDAQALIAALRSAQPDVVFHLAASTVVRDSYLNPVDTFAVNVMGTVLLLDAIREVARPCVVIVVSSDKCYANDDTGRPFRETDPLGGSDPYSASKGAVELATAAYRQSFFQPHRLSRHGVAVASVRAGNVLGGGDWTADGLLADAVRALGSRTPIPLRNPHAIRPWQHVLEPLSGYLQLASRLLQPDAAPFCEPWNFGPDAGNDATVGQVVDRFVHYWGTGSWEDCSQSDQPHESHALRISAAKAAAELGWRPRWQLDEAIGRTAGWYKRYREDPASARAACLDDLAAYTAASRG